jgi:hypothetical protein
MVKVCTKYGRHAKKNCLILGSLKNFNLATEKTLTEVHGPQMTLTVNLEGGDVHM